MNRQVIRRITRVLGAAALMLLAVPSQRAAAQDNEAVVEGARVYGAMCGRCHNPRSPLERDDRDWVTIVNHMRVRANMTGEQVRAVLAFLQATNTNPAEGGTGEPVMATGAAISTDLQLIAEGRELVGQKACLGCHVIGKEGGRVGPSLNGVTSRRDADYLRHKLADPTFDNSTSMMPNFGLTQEQIEAILAYMASLNGE